MILIYKELERVGEESGGRWTGLVRDETLVDRANFPVHSDRIKSPLSRREETTTCVAITTTVVEVSTTTRRHGRFPLSD
ncbi:unnamed protein product [Angiostrongylus costaricensis]|uniref:Uncharacterized protein n=1 Tax=Angiostrongylus costaricensis TaxID=334426 RepID=A0A0R3PZH0_ANGCS|nr:unnamed protein product [Angiostrongylus costaricensis]